MSQFTVMAVEDSSSLRTLISATLRVGGFDVVEAVDGADALQKLKQNDIDLLISDVNMPNVDGIELAKRVRQMPGRRFLPIILITSEGDNLSRKANGKQAGASGWISKPFAPDKLLKLTRMVLGQS